MASSTLGGMYSPRSRARSSLLLTSPVRLSMTSSSESVSESVSFAARVRHRSVRLAMAEKEANGLLLVAFFAFGVLGSSMSESESAAPAAYLERLPPRPIPGVPHALTSPEASYRDVESRDIVVSIAVRGCAPRASLRYKKWAVGDSARNRVVGFLGLCSTVLERRERPG